MQSVIYILFITIILCSCEKEVSVSPPDQIPPQGKIVLNTYPGGFDIYVNNKNRARKTPDSLSWLKGDEYLITLKKKLFADSVFSVNLPEDERIYMFIDYAGNPRMLGSLNVNSVPEGASIFLNDVETFQVTPFTFTNLLPGEYKVGLKLNNHLYAEYSTIISSSKETFFKEGLIDSTIWELYNYKVFPQLSNYLLDIEIDNNGKIWIGSRNGLIIYDGKWDYLNTDNSYLPHQVVHDIELDNENNLWLATPSGFALVKNNEVVMRYLSNGQVAPVQQTTYKTDFINTLLVKDGLPYYFGFDKGVGVTRFKFPGDQYSFFTPDPINPSILVPHFYTQHFITSIAKLKDEDKILFGTKGNGILVSTEELIIANIYNEYNRFNYALPTNNISKIISDDLGGAWILFSPDVSTSVNTIAYYKNNNFQYYNFSTVDPKIYSMFIDSKKITWLGTDDGILFFNDFNNKHMVNFEKSGIKFGKVTGFTEDTNGNIWIITADAGLVKVKNTQLFITKFG